MKISCLFVSIFLCLAHYLHIERQRKVLRKKNSKKFWILKKNGYLCNQRSLTNKKLSTMKTNINIKRIARSYYYENDIEVSIHSDEYRITLHYFYSLRDANGPQGYNTIKAQAKAAAEAVGEIERGSDAFDEAIKKFHQIMVNNGQELNSTPDFLMDINEQAKNGAEQFVRLEVKSGNANIDDLNKKTNGLLGIEGIKAIVKDEQEKAKKEQNKAKREQEQMKKLAELCVRYEIKKGTTNIDELVKYSKGLLGSEEIKAIIKDMVAKGIIEAPVVDQDAIVNEAYNEVVKHITSDSYKEYVIANKDSYKDEYQIDRQVELAIDAIADMDKYEDLNTNGYHKLYEQVLAFVRKYYYEIVEGWIGEIKAPQANEGITILPYKALEGLYDQMVANGVCKDIEQPTNKTTIPMKATYYNTLGEAKDIRPANGQKFTYEEIVTLIGGSIDYIPLPTPDNKTYKIAIVDDNGLYKPNLLPNKEATKVVKDAYSEDNLKKAAWYNKGILAEVTTPGWFLVGPVVILDKELFLDDEDED